MDRDGLERAIAEYFNQQDDVSAVYLFGSQADGTAHAESDVDVGLLYAIAPKPTLDASPFRYEAELSERLGRRVQLIVMNGAPVDLIHRILRAERLLLDKHPSQRIRFEVDSRNRYFDLKPMWDLYRKKSA